MNILKIYINYISNLIAIKPSLEKIIIFWKLRKSTMVSPQRLNNIWQLVKEVKDKKIKGDFVECGVWKGGCVALMSYLSKKYKLERKIWAYDSFEGLPEPSLEDGAKASDYSNGKNKGKLKTIDKCTANENDLINTYKKLNLNYKKLNIRKGWFQNTLPKANKEINKIAILRLDGDWYESTKVCIENLYPLVEKGGYIIIDDYYWWEGANKAIKEYFKAKNIKPKIISIDKSAAYLVKK